MTFSSTLLLVLCTTSALAVQTATTWGSVVFTYHGEKTPSLASGAHHITPHGAVQVLNAGQIIRERYIERRNTTTSTPHFYPINGISPIEIVNSQLNILTLDDEIMIGSALAFTQGLYPPVASNDTDEEHRNVKGYKGLGSLEYYPLDGYQYPAIRTLNTVSDSDSIWLAGHSSCDKYSVSQVSQQNTSSYINLVQSTYKFYQGLRRTVLEYVNTDAGQVDFRKAEELYEYALYESIHNYTHGGPNTNFKPDQLAQLLSLASEQQFQLHSANISSIAGQTLAGKVLSQLNMLMLNSGSTDKLSLMFTSFEPFLSFFALSRLSAGPSASKFRSLPNHGSIMAFELFSYTELSSSNVTKLFPSQADLYVRFLFRNGSEDTLTAYPLFGNSPSNTDLRWYDFVRSMEEFAVQDVNDWCNVCETQNVFCRQLQNLPAASEQSGTHSYGLSPVVSGLIGALVVLALAVLAFVALALLGFRLQRTESKVKGSKSDLGVLRTSSGNGGYKGAEKLASDTDLRLKSGAGAGAVVKHERVGSWELKDCPQPQSPSPVHPNSDKDLESGRIRSYVDYNRRSQEYEGLERVNPFGDPLKHADQI